MDLTYLITPFLAWFVSGFLKFLIFSIKKQALAFDLMGNGGMPSTHTTVVVSTATLIALRQGVDSAAFGIAVTLAFIIMIDANSLRRHVGKQAVVLNRLTKLTEGKTEERALRERMGHSRREIFVGILLGMLTGYVVFLSSPVII